MLQIHAYNTQTQTYSTPAGLAALPALLADAHTHLWIDCQTDDPAELQTIGEALELDPLTLEDCLSPRQLPKVETFEAYHFVLVKALRRAEQMLDEPFAGPEPNTDEADGVVPQKLEVVQLNCYIGERFLVTHHRHPAEAVNVTLKHVANRNSQIRQGVATLAYEILDRFVDLQAPVLDYFEDRLDGLQQQLFASNLKRHAAAAYLKMTRQLQLLRRISVRNQQVFYQLSHASLEFIDEQQARYFKDVYDHLLRMVELSDQYQQNLREALTIQLSLNGTKVNQIVLFLTMLTTMLLPLNVVTGLYGMNFKHMPLLNHPFGFWMILGVMLALALSMLLLFKRRRWL
ncbi:MAG: magnesium transporter CorA family protein [Vampirovibrionales bacterium]|nr:magnesium transporter CorA family protein [Vampirovibrionales bacterium]